MLSVCTGQVTHALLTRPPLSPKRSLDLHVLGTPPAFILSQDQTLKIKFFEFYIANEFFANAQNSVAQNKISLLYPLRCYLKISGMVCMAFELFVRTKYICCSVFKVHLKWWTIRDSNPRPTGYEPGALTNWANGPLYIKYGAEDRNRTGTGG